VTDISTSIWPLIAAALAVIIIGYVWYHPWIFGTLWMRFNGVTPEMAERGARRAHMYEAIGFLTSVVVAYVMRTLLVGLGVSDPSNAAKLGFLVWLGCAAPVLLGSVLWEHRPFKLYLINAGYWLVALTAMSVILVV